MNEASRKLPLAARRRLLPKTAPLHTLTPPIAIVRSTMVISTGHSTARRECGYSRGERQGPRKLLMQVTVGRCVGAVRVVVSREDTVADLVAATVEAYMKEMRRPLLGEKDPCRYRLHYSQFCLQGIEPDENVMNLGSRNFFLCTSPALRSSPPDSSPKRASTRSNPPPFSVANLMDFLMFSSWP